MSVTEAEKANLEQAATLAAAAAEPAGSSAIEVADHDRDFFNENGDVDADEFSSTLDAIERELID